ncbi:MAG: ABC transporter permease [Candidatus Thorarchaeota archaeon]|nr:ABC transporter permease [Candidatus Thorarchaeota archaeon]
MKGSWKDSNWYVSISGFWREYRRHRIGMIGVFVLILFFGVAIFAPYLVEYSPSPSAKVAPPFLAPSWVSLFDPTGVQSGEYLDSPYLTDVNPSEELEVYGSPSYGTGSGFAGQYIAPADPQAEGAKGTVRLTWTHLANDSVRFVWPKPPLPDPKTPGVACQDFVYFVQDFEWPYSRYPKDATMTFEYGITTTGSFATEEYAGLMFQVYIWLIDPSDNWRIVYSSSPPYSPTSQERKIDLNWFDIKDTWGGMVPNDEGIKEDGDKNVVKAAFALVPTYTFRTYSSSNPWMFYNGSVTLDVNVFSAYVYGDYFGTLGTTDKGADAWSQLIFGSRISLYIGLIATFLSTIVGVIVGMVAGYFGGKTDEVLMRIVDFLLVIPGLPLMMVLAAFMGPSINTIIVVIAILGWTGTARLIRSQVLAEKNKSYVESARAIGASDTYIIFRHVLPNVTPILFANITLGVVGAILSEAGLSFLGLTDPSQPSWGRMLADANSSGGFSNGAWWVVVSPGLMITVLSLAFTFVGHTLDQVLNPRLRER